MLEDWAGVAIIVSVQIVTFFFIKRRLDRLDEAISRLEKSVAGLREQTAAMHTELMEQLAATHREMMEQIAAMNTKPSMSCCTNNPRGTATTKNEQTMCMCIYCDCGVVNAPSDGASSTPGRSSASHSDANCRQS